MNIILLFTVLAGGIWYVVEGREAQSYLGERLGRIEQDVELLQATDTRLEVMRLTVENLTSYVNRLDTQLVSLRNGHQEALSKIRDLERTQLGHVP